MLLRAVKYLLLPPAVNILLFIAAWFLLKPWPRLRLASLSGSLLSLWLFSTPLVAIPLADLLQNQYPALNRPQIQQAGFDVIVVLGAGRDYRADEWLALRNNRPQPSAGASGHHLNSFALQRLHYAAELAEVSRKPLLLTGGRVYGEADSEAELMQNTLVLWDQQARWLESDSRTTAENAYFSARILQAEGIKKIALVTHGWHMPRAVSVFEKAGFQITPAPTAFYAMPDSLFLSLLPRSYYLDISGRMLHELLGQLWYRLRYSG